MNYLFVSERTVWILLGGKAVQLEDFGHVVELAVHVAAHGELGIGGHVDVDQPNKLKFVALMRQKSGLLAGEG